MEGFLQACGFEEQLEFPGDNLSPRLEQAGLEIQDVLDHVFVEQVVADLLVDDDIETTWLCSAIFLATSMNWE